MYRVFWAILVIPALLAGCTASQPADLYAPPQTSAHTGMLFDTHPGYPSADQLVFAGDWPTADARIQGGERIYYRMSIHDIQGLRNAAPDFTYRRFRMERVGTAAR